VEAAGKWLSSVKFAFDVEKKRTYFRLDFVIVIIQAERKYWDTTTKFVITIR